MPKFCAKCGEKLRAGKSFCVSCGAKIRKKTGARRSESVSARPQRKSLPGREAAGAVLSPPPPKSGGSGCGVGCAIGCLAVVIIFILVIALALGAVYYFLFMREGPKPGSYFDVDEESKKLKTVKCDDSLTCLEQNFKKCEPAEGETELGDFTEAEIKILGTSGKNKDCIVYLEIKKIKKLPSQLEILPDFLMDKLKENMNLECSVPKNIYEKGGVEDIGEYIGDNLAKSCKGPLFDLFEKFGIDIEDIEDY